MHQSDVYYQKKTSRPLSSSLRICLPRFFCGATKHACHRRGILPKLCCLPSEFDKIVDSPDRNVLTLENNCESYERWSLVKVVSGRRETIRDGRGINDCTEIDITQSVKSALPGTFLSGAVRSHGFNLRGIQTAIATCPKGDMSYFVAWNCTPGM